VAAAHAQGSGAFDIVLNHPGYGDLQTLSEVIVQGREEKRHVVERLEAANCATITVISTTTTRPGCAGGGDWIRSGLRGYTEAPRRPDDAARLPADQDEQDKPVGVPPFFKNKPIHAWSNCECDGTHVIS